MQKDCRSLPCPTSITLSPTHQSNTITFPSMTFFLSVRIFFLPGPALERTLPGSWGRGPGQGLCPKPRGGVCGGLGLWGILSPRTALPPWCPRARVSAVSPAALLCARAPVQVTRALLSPTAEPAHQGIQPTKYQFP